MKKIPTLFLKSVLIFMGLASIGICILLFVFGPQEAPESFPTIVTNFLHVAKIGAYLSIIPFFIILYQAFRLLCNIDTNNAFSESSIKALKIIKYSTFMMMLCYLLALPFIYLAAEYDDAPGLILIGTAFCFAPIVPSVFAAVLQKLFRNAVDIKNENDLTV